MYNRHEMIRLIKRQMQYYNDQTIIILTHFASLTSHLLEILIPIIGKQRKISPITDRQQTTHSYIAQYFIAFAYPINFLEAIFKIFYENIFKYEEFLKNRFVRINEYPIIVIITVVDNFTQYQRINKFFVVLQNLYMFLKDTNDHILR